LKKNGETAVIVINQTPVTVKHQSVHVTYVKLNYIINATPDWLKVVISNSHSM